MQIFKTTDYFQITAEEAAKKKNGYCTVEEAKILDTGEEQRFFATLEGLTDWINSDWTKSHIEYYEYNVILFELVAENDNNNKYCAVFENSY